MGSAKSEIKFYYLYYCNIFAPFSIKNESQTIAFEYNDVVSAVHLGETVVLLDDAARQFREKKDP